MGERELKEQLLERVSEWFDRVAPRVCVGAFGQHSVLEIHLDPGDECWFDDGRRCLRARLTETNEADALEGPVPEREDGAKIVRNEVVFEKDGY